MPGRPKAPALRKAKRKRGPAPKSLAERVARGDARAVREQKAIDDKKRKAEAAKKKAAAAKRKAPAKKKTATRKTAKRAPKKKPETKKTVSIPNVIVPPDDLKGLALEVWRLRAPGLAENNILTPEDAAGFARYCQLTAHYVNAEELLSASNSTDKDALAAVIKLSTALERFEDRYGMNPAHRQALFSARARGGAIAPGGAPSNVDAGGDEKPDAKKPVVDEGSAQRSPVGFLH